MLNRKQKISGFTIVELLIVIVVIGILAAITIVSYTGISQKAVASALQSDLKNAVTKLKLYQVDNSAYPVDIDCAAVPAANTICLKPSSNNIFDDYSANNTTNPQTFRLVARSTNNTSYVVTESTSPITGGVATVPINLAATDGINQVSLTWAAPTSDGGSPITGYKLYRGTTNNPTTLVQTLGNVTSYTNTGLTAGTTYYFRIQAINATGDSGYSNNASAAAIVVDQTLAYTGALQTWTVPATGAYKLEVWGAKGGCTLGGYGGYSYSNETLTAGTVLKVVAGGQGVCYSNNATYGGGGGILTTTYGGSGGGASVIGVDNTLFYAIGGGGGGGTTSTACYPCGGGTSYGGHGGGGNGAGGSGTSYYTSVATGGTGGTGGTGANIGGSLNANGSGTYGGVTTGFGIGGGGTGATGNYATGGGGGGYGGGGGSYNSPSAGGGTGAGGGGYAKNGGGTTGANSAGNGYVRITSM